MHETLQIRRSRLCIPERGLQTAERLNVFENDRAHYQIRCGNDQCYLIRYFFSIVRAMIGRLEE